MRTLSCFAVLILSASYSIAAEPTLSVGFGECDVTPAVGGKTPVYIAGYGHNRPATKVHDPIMARAVVLSDGAKKIALVSVDVVGLFLPAVEDVRSKLKGFDYVLVSSTHNHEGPDTLGLWGKTPFESGVDPAYLKTVIDGAAKAVQAADKKLAPAVAKIGSAHGPELIRDGRLPELKHDDMVAIRFDAPDAKTGSAPLGLLVQWNCHPEILDDKNTEVSADHVGYTVKHLADKYKCPVAYFTGTVGGLMTSLRVPLKDKNGNEMKDGTFEKCEAFGVAVGKLGEKAVESAVTAKLVPFTVRTKAVLTPVDNGLYRVAWQMGVFKRPLYVWEGNSYPAEFKEGKDVTKPVALKTEVGYLKLGELEVAAIPGEIYPELVLDKIQEPVDPGADFPNAPKEPAVYTQMKAKHKMLIGLANDEIGYIIPKRQWDEQKPFCYGRKDAQYGEVNSCGPDVAMALCAAFKELVGK
jgi:hypothetical protein